jgi:hypothetical protein
MRFISIFAAIMIIIMFITDRTILYCDLSPEEIVWAPKRSENPFIFWLYIIHFIAVIIIIEYFKYIGEFDWD